MPALLAGRRGVVALAVVVALVVVAAVAVIATRGDAEDSRGPLVWSESFDGAKGTAPDPAVWSPVTGGNGWGNDELECYTDAPGNVSLDGQGHLAITAIKQPGHVCSDGKSNDYTSARIQTLGKKSFTTGEIDVRAQMPTGSGAWPAIWAQGVDYPTAGWPACGELDISEVVGSHPDQTISTLHGPSKADSSKAYDLTKTLTTGAPLSAGFHTYGVKWSASKITFTFDGKTVNSVTKQQAVAAGGWPFDQPVYLILDLAVGGNLPGAPNGSATWPQTMLVDSIKAYS